jgi:IclR family mhp operon transcriptional activator
LEALNRRPTSSVDQLHRETLIPKPTVVRLLRSLVHAGYVVGDGRQGGYQVAARVQSLSSGFHGDALVVEAGRAWAVALTRRLKWPLAIALLDNDAMVVRFSTIPDSPISPIYSTINQRFSLTSHAIGRAYLAFCSEEERALLLSPRATGGPDPAVADRKSLQHMLAAIRAQGFAERDPLTLPRNSSTVAVPIVGQDRLLATLGLTYFTSAVSRATVVGDYVPLLQEAARSLAEQNGSIARAP